MQREFKTLRNENGGEVQVTTVTKEQEGPVQTLGGVVETREGDVLIATGNPSVFISGYDVDGWSEVDAVDAPTPTTDQHGEFDDVEDEDFDPSTVNADVVRRYLEKQKADGNRDEFNRVVAAEQGDKNRASALVDYDK